MNTPFALLTTLLLCTGPLCQAAKTPPCATEQDHNKYNIAFHESWTPQQRADLLKLYRILHNDLPEYAIRGAKEMNDLTVEANADDTPEQIAEKLVKKIENNQRKAKEDSTMTERMVARAATRPMRSLLKKTASAGRGNIYNKDGLSLAYLAIRLGMTDLAKELVRRGTDPNQRYNIGSDIAHPGPAYEDLLCAAVGQSPLCETAFLTPQQAEDMVQWLLNNGADPNKSDLHMLNLCCQMEMMFHNSCAGTSLILSKLNSLPAELQADLAATMLHLNIPGSWSTFESLFNKGLFTREGIEINETLFLSICTYAPTDAPEKTKKLIDLGFNPNFIPLLRDRKEFDSDEDYEDYISEYCADTPPLVFMIDSLEMMSGIEEEEPQKQQIRLQCIEVLLRHGATAEVYESDLPEDAALRSRLTQLLQQYNVPILTEVDEQEENNEEEYDEYAEEDEEEEGDETFDDEKLTEE